MRNIKITIEYDGSNYRGWQIQDNGPTIQGCIRDAIFSLTMEKATVYGAGRTDSGVHARGQVANFHTKSSIADFAFAKALNSKLPDDIVIRESIQVSDDFHAQFHAKAKAYCYRIYYSRTRPALERNYVHWIFHPLDVKLMQQASIYLLGTHDFSSFEAANSPRVSSVRTVNIIDISEKNCYIEILIEANGFLYRMVRNIVGTLIQIGQKKFLPEAVTAILQSQSRSEAGPTVSASGLYLEYVKY